MQNKHMQSCLKFSRVFCLASLYAAFGTAPALAQITVPAQIGAPSSGAGQVAPCDVGAAASSSAAFPCGVIMFSPQGTVSSSDLAGRARGAGADIRFEYRLISAAAARVSDRATLRALVGPGVILIPDRRVNAIAKPGSGGGGTSSGQITPAGVQRIGAAPEQAVFNGTGSGVGVAIVDTGLDFNQADFVRGNGSSAISSAWFDAHGGNGQDQNGHGTHVGGIVAAQNNSIGVVGVAPGVTLYAVRVLDASGSGSDADVMAGLDWIWAHNSDSSISPKISVANMSLGRTGTAYPISSDDNPALHASVTALYTQGVTIVVAAGNNPTLEISQEIPAAYKEVLAIASTTALDGTESCSRLSSPIKTDTASYFTTDGAPTTNSAGVAVSAPGEDQENVSRGCQISSVGILSLKLGGGTTRMSGTSMASPHAAGVAALLSQKCLGISPDAIRSVFKASAFQTTNPATLPLDAPTTSYTFDGVREGILSAPGALASCP